MKCSCRRSARGPSTFRLSAITPPNADIGSQARAFSYGVAEPLGRGHAAGVVVLDDHARRRLELVEQAPRGVEVEDVVERERAAVELRHPREHVRPGPDLHVERRLLVRVLAVGQVEELLVRHHPVLGELLVPIAEPAADRRVVAGGEGERLVREPVARLARDAAAGLLELGQHRVVALGLHHHGDGAVVLGRRPDHGRAADVDVLDRVGLGHRLPRDRALERVQVHAHEVDRLDPLGLERLHVLGVVADGQERRVQPRVKRLDAAAEDLRRAGELGDVADLDPGLAQRRCGPARGHDLDPQPLQAAREVDDPASCRRPRSAPAGPCTVSSGRAASSAPAAGVAGSAIAGRLRFLHVDDAPVSIVDARSTGGDQPDRLRKQLDARPRESPSPVASGRECKAR